MALVLAAVQMLPVRAVAEVVIAFTTVAVTIPWEAQVAAVVVGM